MTAHEADLAERILDLITRAVRSGSLSERDKALEVLESIRVLCSVHLARSVRRTERFATSVYARPRMDEQTESGRIRRCEVHGVELDVFDCYECGGSGTVRVVEPCPTCGGIGVVFACPVCDGVREPSDGRDCR